MSQKHPQPPPPPKVPQKPAVDPKKLEAWRRLMHARVGTTEYPIFPPDAEALAAALEIVAGWGGPEPIIVVERVPLPPPEVGERDVTVYIYADPHNPNLSVRTTDWGIVNNPHAVIADMQSAWIRA